MSGIGEHVPVWGLFTRAPVPGIVSPSDSDKLTLGPLRRHPRPSPPSSRTSHDSRSRGSGTPIESSSVRNDQVAKAKREPDPHSIRSFTQKCLDLGAATAIVYDFCLTFERERRIVWNQAGSRVNFTRVLWVAVGVRSSNEASLLHSATSIVMEI